MISVESCLELMQANLFKISAEKGYDSEKFINGFLRSELCRYIDMEYSRYQFMDELYWMEELEDFNKESLVPGTVLDEDELYWMGHIYREWHFTTGESSKQILRKMSVKKMHKLYNSEYYIDCDSVIEIANSKSKNVK